MAVAVPTVSRRMFFRRNKMLTRSRHPFESHLAKCLWKRMYLFGASIKNGSGWTLSKLPAAHSASQASRLLCCQWPHSVS